jgi:hypothetical protein
MILTKLEGFFDKLRLPSENIILCQLILDLFSFDEAEFPLEQLQWWLFSLQFEEREKQSTISAEKQKKIDEFNQGIIGLRTKYFGSSKADNTQPQSKNLISILAALESQSAETQDENIEDYQQVLRDSQAKKKSKKAAASKPTDEDKVLEQMSQQKL